MVQGLLTPEQGTQHQTVLQENEAMDTQRLLKTEVMVYAALQNFSCLKMNFFNGHNLNNFTQGFF